MKTEREEQGTKFLDFVAKNEVELRRALEHTIAKNAELFEDVFQEAILRVYGAIMRGSEVKDFRSYFFMSCRAVYIEKDSREKNRRDKSNRDWFANHEIGDADSDEPAVRDAKDRALRAVIIRLSQRFGFEVVAPYILSRIKKEGFRPRNIAEDAEVDLKSLRAIMKEISDFIATDETINQIKRELHDAIYN